MFIENVKRERLSSILRKFVLRLCVFAALLPFNMIQADAAEDDSWSNVFKFQSKMAAFGSVKAQFILGEMYEEGRGVKQNLTEAIKWYSKAQKNGHPNAAARISAIKNRISQAKLKKKIVARKILPKKKNKEPTPAKPRQNKAVIRSTKELTPTKAIPITNTIEKEPVSQPDKKPRIHTSPEDFNRGKGTHMDDFEDPFE